MVHEDPWHAGNPYIFTLIEEIKRQQSECIVSWGRDLFWSDEIFSYNIVHFHWPQAFMAGDRHTEEDLLHHIGRMKNQGVKVVSTCHDLEPHYSQCAEHSGSMRIVYAHSDAILHLGNYSKSLFETKYPHSVHFPLPHHLYDTLYKIFPSKEESAKYLNLPSNKTYILCFGTFRSDEERDLVIRLNESLRKRNIRILAPGFLNVNYPRSTFVGIKQRLRKLFYQYRYGIYCTGKEFAPVPEKDVPYYYGVADIAFIQRVKILNSGNAVLPMLFGKVVVGPNTGNVGPLLKKWCYPVFDVNDLSTVTSCVIEGLEKAKHGIAKTTQKQQLEEYSTKRITEQLYIYYCTCINNLC